MAEAGRRGIRVLSTSSPTTRATSTRGSSTPARRGPQPDRDWYVWADPKPDGVAPNNWVSSFGGPAWTLDAATGQYYLHNHLAEQPDLNWWNEEVRDGFDAILRFWFDRGVAGFRIDVCNIIIKDAELRDNPPATEDDDFEAAALRATTRVQRQPTRGPRRAPPVATARRLLRPASGARRRDPGPKVEALAAYYGDGRDELHLAFNFPFITAPFDAAAMRPIVEDTESALPRRRWPAWTGSNHDMSRFATRWAGGDPRRPGWPCHAAVPAGHARALPGRRDRPERHRVARRTSRPSGRGYWPAYAGRDAMRTPMPWRDGPGGASPRPASTRGSRWATAPCNVEDQRADPDSMLHLARDLIALRRQTRPQSGAYRSVAPPGPGPGAGTSGSGRWPASASRSDGTGRSAGDRPVRRGMDGFRSSPVGGGRPRSWRAGEEARLALTARRSSVAVGGECPRSRSVPVRKLVYA